MIIKKELQEFCNERSVCDVCGRAIIPSEYAICANCAARKAIGLKCVMHPVSLISKVMRRYRLKEQPTGGTYLIKKLDP